MQKSRVVLAGVGLVGFAGAVAVNVLATTLPLGGRTTGELSDQYPNLFVPSGLTFSIWGVICILLVIYCIAALVISLRNDDVPDGPSSAGVGYFFVISCLANACWILSWHYEVLSLSMACMLVLLVSLVLMYRGMNIGRSSAGAGVKYCFHLAVSIYLGWITIATIANATALSVAFEWRLLGAGGEPWAVIMIGIGTVLALCVLLLRNDVFYALVVGWALLGIFIKRTSAVDGRAEAVVAASIVGMALIVLGVIVQILRRRVYRRNA